MFADVVMLCFRLGVILLGLRLVSFGDIHPIYSRLSNSVYPCIIMRTKKLMMTTLTACMLGMLPTTTLACYGAPKYAKISQDIARDFIENKGPDKVHAAEFNQAGQKVYAFWHEWGNEKSFLYVYFYDENNELWTQCVSQLVDGSEGLSAEIVQGGKALAFKNTKGDVVFKESLSQLQAKMEQAQRG